MSDFYFALARITVAQICRASGIERCSQAVLDALTDVFVRYLMLLGADANTALEARDGMETSAADAMLVMSQHGASRSPGAEGVEDIVDFLRWLKGPVQQRLVRVARPQKQGSSLLGAAQGAALAALPSSAAAAAAAAEGNTLDRPPTTAPSSAGAAAASTLPEAPNDWLKAVLNQQMLMGHRKKFSNTPFGAPSEIDPVIWGDTPPESPNE